MASRIVDIVFKVLENHGVRRIVCSPGSRNAELLLAVSANPDLKKVMVVDERVAGFTALGMAQVSQEPVALVCTSGSAVLNYAPALSEAYYQGLPLVVLSADRPAEWIDQDDSQTIRQFEILSHIVKCSYDINTANLDDNYLWFVNRTLNEGMLNALKGKPGPVHFNIHLGGEIRSDYIPGYPERKIEYISGKEKISENQLEALARHAFDKKIMIVCGFMPADDSLQKTFGRLLDLPNVTIMAETLSNLHLGPQAYMVDSVLCHLSDEQKEFLKPDIVISVGGALVSRMLKEYLRKFQPEQHWSINKSDNLIDCFKSLTVKIDISPARFLNGLSWKIRRLQNKRETGIPDYGLKWFEIKTEFLKRNRKFSQNCGWSDLKALSIVFKNIPDKANLFLSNGTSVRYAQILSESIPHAIFGNRGVSGIEGSLSAAIGASLVYSGLTVLLIGDMSFLYDIGSLNTGLAGSKLRVIMLSNGGGDIFRFIPMTSQLKEREEYFCMNPEIPVKEIISAYNWRYYEATDEKSLESVLEKFFDSSDRPCMLNLMTASGDKNSKILRNFLNIKY